MMSLHSVQILSTDIANSINKCNVLNWILYEFIYLFGLTSVSKNNIDIMLSVKKHRYYLTSWTIEHFQRT